jgi:hypothetical protein
MLRITLLRHDEVEEIDSHTVECTCSADACLFIAMRQSVKQSLGKPNSIHALPSDSVASILLELQYVHV